VPHGSRAGWRRDVAQAIEVRSTGIITEETASLSARVDDRRQSGDHAPVRCGTPACSAPRVLENPHQGPSARARAQPGRPMAGTVTVHNERPAAGAGSSSANVRIRAVRNTSLRIGVEGLAAGWHRLWTRARACAGLSVHAGSTRRPPTRGDVRSCVPTVSSTIVLLPSCTRAPTSPTVSRSGARR